MTDRNPWLNERKPDQLPKPHCPHCRGKGWNYMLGWAKYCHCRYKAPNQRRRLKKRG